MLLIATVLLARFFPSVLVFHSFPQDLYVASTGGKLAGKGDLEMLSAVTLPMAALHNNFARRK